jgi:hypothetical protein
LGHAREKVLLVVYLYAVSDLSLANGTHPARDATDARRQHDGGDGCNVSPAREYPSSEGRIYSVSWN